METTLDGLLNRRITLEQPAVGYRVAVDTVLVAAAVPAKPKQRVLELGCGVGGAMLCLAARVPELSLTGVEIQPELAELCQKNLAQNKMESEVLQSDIADVALSDFDHVFMNPPYHDEMRHDVSNHPIKRTANTEKEGDLSLWIKSAAQALKDKGTLTLIHRADRVAEILSEVKKHFGAAELLNILTKPDAPAKRVIIRAQKSTKWSVTPCAYFTMHAKDGSYTEAANAILRDAAALEFKPEL